MHVAPDDPASLPDGARRLLLGPVDSFEKLEVLLTLRDAADSSTTLEALAGRARVPVEQVGQAAAELAAAGLVERLADGACRLGAADEAALADLATAWVTCRPAVLKILSERAVDRIRASAARVFADAFRLRKRQDEGEGNG